VRQSFYLLCCILLLSSCGAKDFSSTSSPVSYEIRDGTVFRVSAFGEQAVATNADDASAVRPGPDGRSLHFREKNENVRCALMGSGAGDGLAARPPSEPWAYPSIASYGSVSGCGFMGQTSGFLRSTEAFASVSTNPSNTEAILTVELAADGTSMHFPVTQTWTELLRTTPYDAVESGGTSLVGGSLLQVLGNDGRFYSYPQQDAALADGRIILAFGDLLIAIDTRNQRLLGTVRLSGPERGDIQNDAFSMRTDVRSPFGILSSGWEGTGRMEAIIDMRGDTLVLHSLGGIPQPYRSGYALPVAEWNGATLLLHLYHEVDVFDTLSDGDRKLLRNSSDDVGIMVTQVTQRLKKGGSYLDAVCGSAGMDEAFCTALLPGAEVELSSQSDVQETLKALRLPAP